MKVIAVPIMVMGSAFEVKQGVLFLLFMRDKRSKAGQGQRLPAEAKNEKRCDQTSNHAGKLTSVLAH